MLKILAIAVLSFLAAMQIFSGVIQSGTVSPGDVVVWASSGIVKDGGPLGTILSSSKVTLSANVPLNTSGAFVTILSDTVTMPVSCPCHVMVIWKVTAAGGGGTPSDFGGVEDGSNNSTHRLLAPATYASGGNTGGMGASEYSNDLTYSGNVTFTLVAATTATASSPTILAANPVGIPAGYTASNGYLEILVMP